MNKSPIKNFIFTLDNNAPKPRFRRFPTKERRNYIAGASSKSKLEFTLELAPGLQPKPDTIVCNGVEYVKKSND